MSSSAIEFTSQDQKAAIELIRLGLAEDLGTRGDLTSSVFLAEAGEANVAIRARANGIISGLPIASMVLAQVDPALSLRTLQHDGSRVEAGTIVAEVNGPAQLLLTAERTALNFLTHLSGVATLTRRFVNEVAGTSARILDTRKTHPGFRLLEKYAVRCGGGDNHRMGLHDAFMIKDNHLAARQKSYPEEQLSDLIPRARQAYPEAMVIVEVDRLDQLEEVLPGQPDVVLLDNMDCDTMRQAVTIRNRVSAQTQLEASGGITLETVRKVAETDIDRISIGALTHSAPAFDLGFDWLS